MSTLYSRLNSTRNAKRANTVKSVEFLNSMMPMMQAAGIRNNAHLFWLRETQPKRWPSVAWVLSVGTSMECFHYVANCWMSGMHHTSRYFKQNKLSSIIPRSEWLAQWSLKYVQKCSEIWQKNSEQIKLPVNKARLSMVKFARLNDTLKWKH